MEFCSHFRLNDENKNWVRFIPFCKKIGKRGGLIGKPTPVPILIDVEVNVSSEGVFSVDQSEIVKFLDTQENFVIKYKEAQWKIVEPINKELILQSIKESLERYTKWEQLDIERKRKWEQEQRELAEIESKLKEKLQVINESFPNRFFSFDEKKRIANNLPFSVSNGGVNLGRCYNKYSYLVFFNGNEKVAPEYIPKGNGDNYSIVSEGEHPQLGKFIETTCVIDSSD